MAGKFNQWFYQYEFLKLSYEIGFKAENWLLVAKNYFVTRNIHSARGNDELFAFRQGYTSNTPVSIIV